MRGLIFLILMGCTVVPYEERDAHGYSWRLNRPPATIIGVEYVRNGNITLKCGGKAVMECAVIRNGECRIFIDSKYQSELWLIDHAKRHCAGWDHVGGLK